MAAWDSGIHLMRPAAIHVVAEERKEVVPGLGLGLPGVRRLMDEFAVVSQPGRGTSVTDRRWKP